MIKAGPLITNGAKIQIPKGWKWFIFEYIICFKSPTEKYGVFCFKKDIQD